MKPVRSLTLQWMPGRLAVCRLPADVTPTDVGWAFGGTFTSWTRTPDEVSIVCDESSVPGEVRAERGWVALRIAGTLDFGLVGILAELSGVLASAGVSLFAVSTFDTDYLLIRSVDSARAVGALRSAGHSVLEPEGPAGID
ncbi:MAG: ACT domain-containing protein [Isosphaeraceae bacterium]